MIRSLSSSILQPEDLWTRFHQYDNVLKYIYKYILPKDNKILLDEIIKLGWMKYLFYFYRYIMNLFYFYRSGYYEKFRD